jgi:hypothetical protein
MVKRLRDDHALDADELVDLWRTKDEQDRV